MPTLDPVGPQVPPVDYGDKLAAAKRSLFTPPRGSLFTPPLTPFIAAVLLNPEGWLVRMRLRGETAGR